MTTTNKRKQQPSSYPKGWHPAGHVTPMSLTVKQQIYCRQAVGISRFIHNLCVATHRFHRNNRMKWPSWQDLSKAFNACKREEYTFATEVSKHVAEGAFRDFGTSIKNWRDPKHSAGPHASTKNGSPDPVPSEQQLALRRSSTTESAASNYPG